VLKYQRFTAAASLLAQVVDVQRDIFVDKNQNYDTIQK
jgi:hypothetical protein